MGVGVGECLLSVFFFSRPLSESLGPIVGCFFFLKIARVKVTC